MIREQAVALCSAGILSLLGTAGSAVPAQAKDADTPTVLCEDVNNDIDVNFQSGAARSNTSIWHGCVSPELPQIVYGEVQSRPGAVTGIPSNATINIPHWRVVFYDSNDDEVAESVLNLTAAYTGLVPQVMLGITTATDPDVQIGVGTASRACRTSDQCTYYNTSVDFIFGNVQVNRWHPEHVQVQGVDGLGCCAGAAGGAAGSP
ncbi:hypothetical protein [Streptomyces sp. NPDC002644]